MAQPFTAEGTALKHVSPRIKDLLKQLHEKSSKQEAAISPDEMKAIKSRFSTDLDSAKEAMDELMRDKFIALDEDKSHLLFNLLIATGARNVVEIGTSFGVSTIYLALAVNQNVKRHGGRGVVVGTEKEETKAAIARKYWKEAGPEIESVIKLSEGDLTEALANKANLPEDPIDFVLMDIWAYVALPALKLLKPHLRPGAVILTDNVIHSKEGYKDYMAVVNDPDGDFSNAIMPYTGGFQMSVYNP